MLSLVCDDLYFVGSKSHRCTYTGADGIRSTIRPLVQGQDAFRTARPSGASAFRFTMLVDQALGIHPNVYNLDKSRPVINDLYLSVDGTNRSLVMYPCRNHELVNFTCIVPDSMVGETTESWTAEGTREDLLSCCEDFCPMLGDLLRHVVPDLRSLLVPC